MSGVIGIVQARLGSARLPGKILAPLAGRPLLAVLRERLRGARVDEWWLATTAAPEDDVTAAWGAALELRTLRGARDDVLSRFTAIVRERRPDLVVRITADDPFTDAAVVNHLLDAAALADKDEGPEAQRWELVEIGGGPPALPLGYAPQLARAGALLEAEREIPADQPWHRSHVLTWLASTRAPLAVPPPPGWPARPGWRWTVDTPEDLAMASAAFDRFGAEWAVIPYPEMVARLDLAPEIPARNRHVRQKRVHEG